MKKAIIIHLLLLLPLNIAFSQRAFIPESNLGVKIGANIAMVSFNPSVNQNLFLGVLGGLSFKHIEQKSLGILLELNYLQAGWDENLDSTNVYSRRLNYIQIPFMTHVNIGQGKVRFVFNVGPYFSFLLNDKEQSYLIQEFQPQEYYYRKIDNRFGYGLCLGVGFSLHTSIGIFQLEGRFNQSLTNLFRSSSDFLYNSSLNQTADISLSYFINVNNFNLRKLFSREKLILQD